jgi:hypothetical protein
MSRHLSSQRISMWMMGERAVDDERHVRECAECAGELARFEATLSRFRGSVQQWSDRHAAASERVAGPVRNAPIMWRLRWAAVAALVLLAVLVPIVRVTHRPPARAAMAQADAQLLEEVDAGVSRPVPLPMEPLLQLVASDTSDTTGATGKENHETKQQK